MWIDEGLALFISGQKKSCNFTRKDLNFFFDNYFSKNIDLIPFAENNGYKISYWAVKMMVRKYGKIKILELLKINCRDQEYKKKLEEIARLFWHFYVS